jgi:hypothetical protein
MKSSFLITGFIALILITTACAEGTSVPPLPSSTAVEKPEQATPIASLSASPTPLPPDQTAGEQQSGDQNGQISVMNCSFASDGDFISGWYWLRDQRHLTAGEWQCSGLLPGLAQPLTLVALVTNQANGGSGFSSPAKLSYTNPVTGEHGSLQLYFQNPLAAQNPNDSSGSGYLTTAHTILPANAVDPEGRIDLRLERLQSEPAHIAIYAKTPRILSLISASNYESDGNPISGWHWLRDDGYQTSAEWNFNGLDPDAEGTILELSLLVTNGVDGGSGYSMPVKITLINPDSGEKASFENVIAQNLLFDQNPSNSQGYGYQTYGSLAIINRFIDKSGRMTVRIRRPESHPYHLAANQGSLQIAQTGKQQRSQAGAGGSSFTQEPADKSACEAIGGKWGVWGLAPQAQCNLPTNDAGAACTNSDQCQSLCLAQLSPEEFEAAFKEGKTFEKGGFCAPMTIVVGCVPLVKDGVVQIICLD